jgi:hypothetical protein
MECPCKKCLIIPICQNKSPLILLRECSLIKSYISSQIIRERFEEFCEIMGKTLTKTNGEYFIIYHIL